MISKENRKRLEFIAEEIANIEPRLDDNRPNITWTLLEDWVDIILVVLALEEENVEGNG